MAKDPADRQSDAARLGRQLQAFQASSGLPITPMVVESETSVEPPPPLTEDEPARAARTFAPRWTLGARLLGVLLVAAAAIAWFLPGRRATVRLSQVFQDNFDAGQGWYEHDDALITLAYEEGQYRLAVKQPRHRWSPTRPSAAPSTGHPGQPRRRQRAGDRPGVVELRFPRSRVPPSARGRPVLRRPRQRGRDGPHREVRRRATRDPCHCSRRPDRRYPDASPPRLPRRPGRHPTSALRQQPKLADVADREGVGPGSAGLVLASGDAPSAEARFDDVVILARRTDVR